MLLPLASITREDACLCFASALVVIAIERIAATKHIDTLNNETPRVRSGSTAGSFCPSTSYDISPMRQNGCQALIFGRIIDLTKTERHLSPALRAYDSQDLKCLLALYGLTQAAMNLQPRYKF